jgi:hypothetical protein
LAVTTATINLRDPIVSAGRHAGFTAVLQLVHFDDADQLTAFGDALNAQRGITPPKPPEIAPAAANTIPPRAGCTTTTVTVPTGYLPKILDELASLYRSYLEPFHYRTQPGVTGDATRLTVQCPVDDVAAIEDFIRQQFAPKPFTTPDSPLID